MAFEINVVVNQAIKDKVLEAEPLLKQTSRKYTREEMASLYEIYNLMNPSKRKSDTGCGSCQRQVLNFLVDKYQKFKKEKEQKDDGQK